MPQPHHKGTYPADWVAIATRVKDDARWCCVRCKAPHSRMDNRVLTVHHFDGDKSNCERWNLMPLCQACHLSVQARVDPEVPLMFEPSTWAMPYIAGFYESGAGMPGPLYDLKEWIGTYTREIGAWPSWAPKEQTR